MHNRCQEHSTLTVEQVNLFLDDLAASADNDSKKNVLARILRKTTLDEQAWIIRIILRDLKVGIRHESVLKNYHPDAMDYYNVSSDLRQVFKDLEDAEKELGKDIFRLFKPIRPMLAGKKNPGEMMTLLEGIPVLIETKFDGERIQCHYKDGEVKFFTRNANDYTNIYGPKMSETIQKNLNCRACILDGEMIVYDEHEGTIVPFGSNKTIANSEGADSEGKHLCYMVFDILYILGHKGEEANLMNARLNERRTILKRVVTTVRNVFEIVSAKETSRVNDIFDEFNKSAQNNEEGIIVKQLDSTYQPNDRSTKWLKMKTDYIEGLGDSLDLCIVGGYFGEGRVRTGGVDWTDHITVFLMAVTKTVDKENPTNSLFYPFCKVGTGYSVEELNKLRAMLKPHWKKYDPRILPSYFPNWTPAMTERPDVYVDDPSKSVVMELKGAEITPSVSFPSGCTLRFPRVLKIRYDKDWSDSMSVEQLQEMISDATHTRALKQKEKKMQDLLDVPEDTSKRRGRRTGSSRKKDELLPQFRDTDTSNVEQTSQLFDNFEFCILNVNDKIITKSELECYIVKHGGLKVQNILPSTTHIIASKIDVKVSNLIRRQALDIIRCEWVIDCMKYEKIIDLSPRYMLHISPYTKKVFSKTLDSYGDSYTKDVDAEEVRDILKVMILDKHEKTENGWDRLTDEETEICKCKTNQFRGFLFFISKSRSYDYEILRMKIEAHGGSVVNEISEGLTHIVDYNLKQDKLPELQKIARILHCKIVNKSWIEEQTFSQKPPDLNAVAV
mmetsp:Transcript_60733/g.69397  ORF Transcript_60733/g.69397 Transcript_60733/m.69397 type:complete len:784 (+) Transcript_60733:504-2855(+)